MVKRKPLNTNAKIAAALICVAVFFCFASYRYVTSFTADHDLHEYIDLPGYYNGPMGAHGANHAPVTPKPKAKPKPVPDVSSSVIDD